MWSRISISIALTNAIPIITDEDGCPTTNQPYIHTYRIMRKLAPLREHNVHTWAHTIRLSPNARPYLLSDEELIYPDLLNLFLMHVMVNAPCFLWY